MATAVTPTPFNVDPNVLSDIMWEGIKGDRTKYDQCGGSVAEIAKLLHVDLTLGLPDTPEDHAKRIAYFGGNFFAEKKIPHYYELVWAGLHDTTILMLIVCAFVGLILNLAIPADHGGIPGYVEPLAILVTVSIVINVAATIDYQKEILFAALNKRLAKTMKRQVIRNGKMKEVTDREVSGAKA